MIWDATLKELFFKGGLMMWPLLFCSVAALGMILERALAFWLMRLKPRIFIEQLCTELAKGRRPEALALCARRHAAARVARAYLEAGGCADAERGRRVEREGALALDEAQQHVGDLTMLSKAATLLGLLGTVTGLAATFHSLEGAQGAVDVGALASGIWEALITTVFGLVIAIPSMAAAHHFQNKVDAIARWMGLTISHLDSTLGQSTPGGTPNPMPTN